MGFKKYVKPTSYVLGRGCGHLARIPAQRGFLVTCPACQTALLCPWPRSGGLVLASSVSSLRLPCQPSSWALSGSQTECTPKHICCSRLVKE